MEVVVLSGASAAAAAGGSGTAALRLPSPRRAQPHAPPHLRRRFRQARHHLPLPGLLSPGQALDHPNHAQADRQSSRRCHRNRILWPFLSYLFFLI